MTTDFDLQSVDASEVFEGVAAVLIAPIMLPLASAVNQPLVKSVMREGIAFSERCQEAVADAQERLEDTLAEAQAEVDERRKKQRHETETEGEPPSDRPSEQPVGDASADEVMIPRREASFLPPFGQQTSGSSTQSASQLKEAVEELNQQLRWLTNDLMDLRLLFSMGLGAMAIRQILVRGLRLDEIPWYVFAWYALDTFVKFHPDDDGAAQPTQERPYIEVQSSTEGV